MSLTTCWQCDLDIPHICYEGEPSARWGLHDGAIEALEAAQHYVKHGFVPGLDRATRATEVAVARCNVKARSMKTTTDLRVPDGWTLEPATGWRDIYVLTAPGLG